MRFKLIVLLGLPPLVLVGCRSRDERMSKLAEAVNESVVAPGKLGDATVIGETSLDGNRNVAGGFPTVTGSRIATSSDVILSREQFVVSFDSKAKVPAWTAWQVGSRDMGTSERSDGFRSDEILNRYIEVKTRDLGVTPEDYTGTCFDRGHQSPSADRTKSQRDNSATFYMSNMAPQTSFLNRIIWKDLEGHSRDLVKNDGRKLQVYAGSILRDGREGIGPNKDIQVPDAFYKVIKVYETDHATKPMGYIAVVMPNVTADGLDPLAEHAAACDEQKRGGKGKQARNWEAYRVPLKDIEAKAGVSFPALADLKAL
jgi:DNA/RNA endonuclease G (NUC1)